MLQAERDLVQALVDNPQVEFTQADAAALEGIDPGKLLCMTKCAAKLAACRLSGKPWPACLAGFLTCIAGCWGEA